MSSIEKIKYYTVPVESLNAIDSRLHSYIREVLDNPTQHNKYRLNKIQTKLRAKNSFLYALLFNNFSQIKKEKSHKMKDIQGLILSPSFLLCQFGGNNG